MSNREAPKYLSNLLEIAKNKCDQCDYTHKYKQCRCSVKCVDGTYIKLCTGSNILPSESSSCKHEVTLMGIPYSLKEARLYAPGLHQYGPDLWSANAAEIVLVHTKDTGNSPEKLIVSIPVKINDSNPNSWFSFITSMGSKNCGEIQSINTSGGWSFEQILPTQFSTPYYYYDATTFPWDGEDSGGVVHYVVYDTANAANISGQNYNILKKLIANTIKPAPFGSGSKLYAYDPTTAKGSFNPGGKYTLNCQPVNIDSEDEPSTTKPTIEDESENIVFYVFLALLAVAFICWGLYQVRKWGSGAVVGAISSGSGGGGGGP